jgi:hypothetical protein
LDSAAAGGILAVVVELLTVADAGAASWCRGRITVTGLPSVKTTITSWFILYNRTTESVNAELCGHACMPI